MKVKDLRKLLDTFDPELEVNAAVYIDRHPFDGDGTDMSGTEYIPMKEDYLKVHSVHVNGNYSNQKAKPSLVIEPKRYDYTGTF